jgi:hypothetical protein
MAPGTLHTGASNWGDRTGPRRATSGPSLAGGFPRVKDCRRASIGGLDGGAVASPSLRRVVLAIVLDLVLVVVQLRIGGGQRLPVGAQAGRTQGARTGVAIRSAA